MKWIGSQDCPAYQILTGFFSLVVEAESSYLSNLQVDLVTAHMATAHIPLTLLVFGLNTDLNLPKGRQASSSNRLCASLLIWILAEFQLPSRFTCGTQYMHQYGMHQPVYNDCTYMHG